MNPTGPRSGLKISTILVMVLLMHHVVQGYDTRLSDLSAPRLARVNLFEAMAVSGFSRLDKCAANQKRQGLKVPAADA